MDEYSNTNGSETAATTAVESLAEIGIRQPPPEASASAPEKFDQHGVNPQWVEEMAPQGQPPALREHEADRGPSSGRTTAQAMPKPELAGQYDPANVRSYFPPQRAQSAYDVGEALKTALTDSRPESYSEFVRNIPDES